MKKSLSINLLMLLSVLSLLQAQNTFNRAYVEDFGGLQFTGLAVTDTAYYAVGVAARAVSPHLSQAAFLTFDTEGNVIHQKVLQDSIWNFEPWCRKFVATDRGSFLTAGYGYGDEADRQGFIAEYFPALDSVRYVRLGYDTELYDFYGTIYGLRYRNGMIYFTAGLGPLDEYNLDLVSFQLNETLEIIKEDYFYHDFISFSGDVLLHENQTILGSGLYNQNQTLFNYKARLRLHFLEEGNLIQTYLSPEGEMWRAPYTIQATADGGFLMATAKGYNLNFPSGPTDSLSMAMWEPYLYKLNSELEQEWIMGFESPGAIGDPNDQMTSLVPATDGNGFVAAGYRAKIAAIPFIARSEGIVAKVTESGELLWDRRFYCIDSIQYDNNLNSLRACPDGGYLLAGLSQLRFDTTFTAPRQQGWLLKLDEYGCLIPGCQGPVDHTAEPETVAPRLLIAPNPVGAQLSVWIEKVKEKNVWLQVINIEGRVLFREENIATPGTYLKNVSDWSSGTYFIQIGIGNQLLKSEQWVKI